MAKQNDDERKREEENVKVVTMVMNSCVELLNSVDHEYMRAEIVMYLHEVFIRRPADAYFDRDKKK